MSFSPGHVVRCVEEMHGRLKIGWDSLRLNRDRGLGPFGTAEGASDYFPLDSTHVESDVEVFDPNTSCLLFTNGF